MDNLQLNLCILIKTVDLEQPTFGEKQYNSQFVIISFRKQMGTIQQQQAKSYTEGWMKST